MKTRFPKPRLLFALLSEKCTIIFLSKAGLLSQYLPPLGIPGHILIKPNILESRPGSSQSALNRRTQPNLGRQAVTCGLHTHFTANGVEITEYPPLYQQRRKLFLWIRYASISIGDGICFPYSERRENGINLRLNEVEASLTDLLMSMH